MSEPARIRIMLVDDHEVVRMGLRAMIDAEPDMTVVAEAASYDECLEAHARAKPDVTLMDLRLPGKSGAEAIAELRRRDAQARVIVLTTYDSDQEIFRALEAGALGYLLKETFRGRILEAIRAVHAGRRVIPPNVAERLAERIVNPVLDDRDREILTLVAKGLTNREVGDVLLLAEDTIKNRLRRIFAKLDVTDRTEAIVVAIQKGLIRPE